MIALKIRTEYTFGKTYAPIPRIIERLKSLGCSHAAIVDYNSTWGHIAWFNACKAANIVPILGVEMAVAGDDDTNNSMWFLAKNKEGLGELYKACSKAWQQQLATLKGSIPRLYKHDVLNMSDNIIKFAGEIVDSSFLEQVGAVIDYSPASKILNIRKRGIAKQCKKSNMLEVNVADNAYAFPEDREVFEVLSGSAVKQSVQYIDVEPEEFKSNSKKIAQQCEGLELPMAPMIYAEGDLEKLCRDGIKVRGLDQKWNEDYETRLNYELGLIRSKNFESYFIIVADMVEYAKKHMLVGPSRGSAAGSLVCYLSRITEIDPLPPKLYFERFIDITRSDLPDIDLDFPDDKRHLVFEYMSNKYGFENVAHIGTISRYKPKSALIHACKALRIPPAATAAVKVAMIERSLADARANNCLLDTLETTDVGKQFIQNYPQAKISSFLEGHASHTGVHAAGLLVCNDVITNYCVVDDKGIAHIEKGSAEALGLLKIDVLGLRTLSVLEDSGLAIDWYNLPFDDKATLDIFNSGKLCGIFQFEGNALRSIAGQLEFKSINEIDAVTALARPGPFIGGVTQKYIERSKGAKYISIHPLVEKELSETFGLPVYQEQTLAIVRNIGKFGWEQTSFVRKAISKRQGQEFFAKFFGEFKKGAEEQGIPEEAAQQVWEMINAMGSWQMNKAHTYSYAVISYWTAYFKAHHPLEFAAATLRSAKDEDSAIELLKEIVKEGIEYIPFDIEKSEINWSAKDGKLYGGFLSLKGIGESKAQKLVAARTAGKLTEKMLDEINKAENLYADIFPFERLYSEWYENPSKFGIGDTLYKIADIKDVPHNHERVFIGAMIYKNPRDANEEVNIKKRGGKIHVGQPIYIDMRLRDDTGMIGARISTFDYLRMGKQILEEIEVGSHLLIRAKFFNNINYAFIKKWKLIK